MRACVCDGSGCGDLNGGSGDVDDDVGVDGGIVPVGSVSQFYRWGRGGDGIRGANGRGDVDGGSGGGDDGKY